MPVFVYFIIGAMFLLLLLWQLLRAWRYFVHSEAYMFRLRPGEIIRYRWQVYSPSVPHSEFPFSGSLFWLVITDQQRLILGNVGRQPLAFESYKIAYFKLLDKPSQLFLFARVAKSKVLKFNHPEAANDFELHVPEEAVKILL